jgi:hypothetical protein
MSLRSTVYWGNDISDGQSVESDEDEETEVESILDPSNPQTGPTDTDFEQPNGHPSHEQAEGHQEVREEHLLRTSKLYNGSSGSLYTPWALVIWEMGHLKHRTL